MRAAIFSHYDMHGIVDDYVLYALRCYRQYFDRIVFVSTSKLNYSQQLKAASLVDAVICRENVGYDFMSWRCGFESLKINQFDSVAFINDSIYGPCNNLDYIMQSCRTSQADLWGASINRQFMPHVQSYFMVFKSNLLRSGLAQRFWSTVEPVESKFDLIMRYEVGLSQFIKNNGFYFDATVDLNYLNKSVRETVLQENAPADPSEGWEAARQIILNDPWPNPVQLFWGEMLRMGAPFVKAEIFKSNPMNANLSAICKKILRDKWYDLSLISNHLERVLDRRDFESVQRSFGRFS